MADKQNGTNFDGEEDNETLDEEKEKGRNMDYGHGPPLVAIDPHAQRQMMPPQMGHAPVVHPPAHHDPRMYPPPPGPHGPYQPYPPPPPPGYYDYPPPPPYHHGPPPQHPPPPQHQHGTDQRAGSQDRGVQHMPTPYPGHPYPGPPPPHHHHYHPPPPPPHYSPSPHGVEQR